MLQPACSNAASADSVVSCNTEPNLHITGQAHSGLSFSIVKGGERETSAIDYQDCGASSVQILGEPPWGPHGPESSILPSGRNDAVMRYREKKKARRSSSFFFFFLHSTWIFFVICRISHV